MKKVSKMRGGTIKTKGHKGKKMYNRSKADSTGISDSQIQLAEEALEIGKAVGGCSCDKEDVAIKGIITRSLKKSRKALAKMEDN